MLVISQRFASTAKVAHIYVHGLAKIDLEREISIASPDSSSGTEIFHITRIARATSRGGRQQRCKKSVPEEN